MSTPDFSALVARHRAHFRTGATRSAQWREGQLTPLRAMMTDRAEDFYAALPQSRLARRLAVKPQRLGV